MELEAAFIICLYYLFLKKSDTNVTNSWDGLTAHYVMYCDMQRIVAIKLKGSDRLTYLSACDTFLTNQSTLVLDNLAVNSIVVCSLLFLTLLVVDNLPFNNHTYIAVRISSRST